MQKSSGENDAQTIGNIHEVGQQYGAVDGKDLQIAEATATKADSLRDQANNEVGRAGGQASISEHDARVVYALIFAEWESQETDEHAISQTMARLELLANTCESVACTLMASLWTVANDLMMHDVCDLIDLWISSCDSGKLTEQLQLLSKENSRKHRHYENLIQNRANPQSG